jgi:hypothetical protein
MCNQQEDEPPAFSAAAVARGRMVQFMAKTTHTRWMRAGNPGMLEAIACSFLNGTHLITSCCWSSDVPCGVRFSFAGISGVLGNHGDKVFTQPCVSFAVERFR